MAQPDHRAAACSPVLNEEAERVEPGIALCLSGGGYRAMIFHLGVLWRLYEAASLKSLKRISSVSGGSITSAALALAWSKLSFDPATGLIRAVFQSVHP